MRIPPFKLERYFARHEFSAPYLLSCSDCEPLALTELLSLADPESLALWEDLRLGYTESQGLPLLRAEVARLHTAVGPEDLLVVVPEEGIFLAMHCMLAAGDHAIVTFPGYQSLYEVAQSLGCEVSRWTPTEEAGEFRFGLEELERLVRPNTRLIIVNFPHNPTGAILSRPDLDALLDIARRRGIRVFSDEMYRFLEHDPSDRLPSVSDLAEDAVSLCGMSKSFALAGLRIGWLATRDEKLMSRMRVFKDYTTICSSAPSEVLALMGLRAKARILERNLGIIAGNLRVLDDFFARQRDKVAWSRPKAGTVGFPKLLLRRPVGEFCQELVERQGVMLLPAEVYDYEGNHFRIGFGRRDLPEALAGLEKALEAEGG